MSQFLLVPEASHTTHFPTSPIPPYLSIVISPRWFTALEVDLKDPFKEKENTLSRNHSNVSLAESPRHVNKFLDYILKRTRLFWCCILNS